MKRPRSPAPSTVPQVKRCAISTRKSTSAGLEKEFNSLDAQRESCAGYVRNQAAIGWQLLPETYDDGGFTGANLERPPGPFSRTRTCNRGWRETYTPVASIGTRAPTADACLGRPRSHPPQPKGPWWSRL